MSSPQISPEQQARIDQVFNRSCWQLGPVLGIVALLLDYLVIIALPSFNFVARLLFCVLLLAVYGLTRYFAICRVRRAGLSLERLERRLIPKQFNSFEGVNSIIRDRKLLSERPTNLIFPLSLAVVFALFEASTLFVKWRDTDINDRFSFAFWCAVILAYVYAWFNSNPVIIRLNTKGVWSATATPWPHSTSWTKIADCEEVRRWDYRGNPQPIDLYFRDTQGHPLLRAGVSPADADIVVAHIEAILTGESKISGA